MLQICAGQISAFDTCAVSTMQRFKVSVPKLEFELNKQT